MGLSRAKSGYRRRPPQRTCVGCRATDPKRSMVRIVRTADGIQVDGTGRLPGRGAYIHEQRSCWDSALKGALGRALKIELTPAAREQLVAYMQQNIPDAQHG